MARTNLEKRGIKHSQGSLHLLERARRFVHALGAMLGGIK